MDFPLESSFLRFRNSEARYPFDTSQEQMTTERKVFAGTKRRRDDFGTAMMINGSALSRRITRLSKTLKASNPTHVAVFDLKAQYANISTTGTILDLCSTISQGDDFFQRFGSHVDVTHINIKGTMQAGSTSTVTSSVRCTLIISEALAFVANMNTSYSPIVDNTVQRLVKDRFYQVASSTSATGFATSIDWSMKIKHRQKFAAPAAGNTINNCLLLLIQSNIVAGTQAPIFQGGIIEVFFKP